MATTLAVDVSASLRQMLAFTLQGAGHKVVEAVTGRDALTKAQKGGVVTEVSMPTMDGITRIRELHKLPAYKFTPIPLLTTELSGEQKVEGKAAGATGWLVEPFNPDQLVAAAPQRRWPEHGPYSGQSSPTRTCT